LFSVLSVPRHVFLCLCIAFLSSIVLARTRFLFLCGAPTMCKLPFSYLLALPMITPVYPCLPQCHFPYSSVTCLREWTNTHPFLPLTRKRKKARQHSSSRTNLPIIKCAWKRREQNCIRVRNHFANKRPETVIQMFPMKHIRVCHRWNKMYLTFRCINDTRAVCRTRGHTVVRVPWYGPVTRHILWFLQSLYSTGMVRAPPVKPVILTAVYGRHTGNSMYFTFGLDSSPPQHHWHHWPLCCPRHALASLQTWDGEAFPRMVCSIVPLLYNRWAEEQFSFSSIKC
jgi:hypothetical protein